MKYQSNRKQVDAAIERGLIRGLDAAAILYQAGVKQALSKHGGPGPSPAGSPPAVQTGTLRRSVQVDRSKNKGKHPKVRIGTNLVYARIHEFGGTITPKRAKALAFQLPDGTWRTAKKVVLPARPYMRPTFKRLIGAMKNAVLTGVRAEVNKVGGVA